MKSPAIEVTGLHKAYGAFEAVAGVDLHVEEGEILAFLGRTGRARPPRWRSSKGSDREPPGKSPCSAKTRPGLAQIGGSGSASCCRSPSLRST